MSYICCLHISTCNSAYIAYDLEGTSRCSATMSCLGRYQLYNARIRRCLCTRHIRLAWMWSLYRGASLGSSSSALDCWWWRSRFLRDLLRPNLLVLWHLLKMSVFYLLRWKRTLHLTICFLRSSFTRFWQHRLDQWFLFPLDSWSCSRLISSLVSGLNSKASCSLW